MIGSNRSGGIRSLVDPRRRSILSAPVHRVVVQRRVHADQVSSYSMGVHKNPVQKNDSGDQANRQFNRDMDPGESEIHGVKSEYHAFIRSLSGPAYSSVVSEANARTGQSFIPHLTAAILGQMVARGEYDEFSHAIVHLNPTVRQDAYSLLGRSTWRQIVRTPELREPVLSSRVRNAWLAGELALNANTVYRQGHDVLSSLLPYVDWVTREIDTIDLPGQQLFNTKSINLIPSSVYPTRNYGYHSVHIGNGKTEWVFSDASSPMMVDQIAALDPDTGTDNLRLSIFGHLNKRPLKISRKAEGLSIGNVEIPWSSVHRTLAGFMISSQDKSMVVAPIVGNHTLSAEESSNRAEFFKRLIKTGDLLAQMKERGSTGFGDNELDLYNTGQYKWSSGRRMVASEDDIVTSVFPHPLIRLAALKYRDTELSPELTNKLGSLIACTLPLVPK